MARGFGVRPFAPLGGPGLPPAPPSYLFLAQGRRNTSPFVHQGRKAARGVPASRFGLWGRSRRRRRWDGTDAIGGQRGEERKPRGGDEQSGRPVRRGEAGTRAPPATWRLAGCGHPAHNECGQHPTLWTLLSYTAWNCESHRAASPGADVRWCLWSERPSVTMLDRRRRVWGWAIAGPERPAAPAPPRRRPVRWRGQGGNGGRRGRAAAAPGQRQGGLRRPRPSCP